MLEWILSSREEEVSIRKGSPSLILRVLLISLGMTILPKSSILQTIPVTFIYFTPFLYSKNVPKTQYLCGVSVFSFCSNQASFHTKSTILPRSLSGTSSSASATILLVARARASFIISL